MTIQCPHCNVSLDGDVNPGDTVECPSCGKGFKVPSAVEIVAAEKKAGEIMAKAAKESEADSAEIIALGKTKRKETTKAILKMIIPV